MTRYVRKDRRVYANALCKVCGTAGGCGAEGCTTMTCLWCATPQCSSNGLGNGHCAVCYYGILPGWSDPHRDNPCAYKGCTKPPVTRQAPRKGRVCADHLAHILGTDYLAQRLTDRDRDWMAVEVQS